MLCWCESAVNRNRKLPQYLYRRLVCLDFEGQSRAFFRLALTFESQKVVGDGKMPSALKCKSFTCKNMWVDHTTYSMFLRYHHLSHVLIRVVINLEVITLANGPRLTDAFRGGNGGGKELCFCCCPAARPPTRIDHQLAYRNDNES